MADAPTLETSCVERFLRYVTYDTQSDESSASHPTTEKQLKLLELLRDELLELGLSDVHMSDHGYVMATVPSTSSKADVPTLGFVAHVDTSPEMPGNGVKPILHRGYQGQRLVLPDDPTAVLDFDSCPELKGAIGHDIVTASGTTLLGADDKAGVAEIMAAVEYLLAHPEIAHGPIAVAFTPDEEVGRGTEAFDVERFGAKYAYTLDGGGRGILQCETFSADAMTVTFKGFNTHPGLAKGTMINSLKIAADFLSRLPSDRLSPETTGEYDGYVHPYTLEGGVEQTTIHFLLRDFETPKLADQAELLRGLAQATVADWPGSEVEIEVREQYRNMSEVIETVPEVVEIAELAMRNAGFEPIQEPIRGGTDGSKLSFMGVPTPNLSSGQHNIHSRLEWADAWEMEKAVEVMIEITKLFEQRASG